MKAGRKKRWKESLARLGRRGGLAGGYLGLCHPFCGGVQTVMLLYHRVVPRLNLRDVCSLPQIVVPLDEFEAQLDYLAGHYHILSLSEFERARRQRFALPLKTAVVTFDDGWEDNYQYAFPALKQRNIPATIFLSTAMLGTGQGFWQEQLLHRLSAWSARLKSGELPATATESLPPELQAAILADHPEPAALGLIEDLKGADERRRTSLLTALDGVFQLPPFPVRANAFMNGDQIREMHDAGIAFGSHAHSHRLLTTLSPDEVAEEVRDSRSRLEAMLGTPVTTFAYPNGSYNAGVMAELKAAGYRLAVTTRKGINTRWTNPLELRRINMNGATCRGSNSRFSEDLFAAKLASGGW